MHIKTNESGFTGIEILIIILVIIIGTVGILVYNKTKTTDLLKVVDTEEGWALTINKNGSGHLDYTKPDGCREVVISSSASAQKNSCNQTYKKDYFNSKALASSLKNTKLNSVYGCTRNINTDNGEDLSEEDLIYQNKTISGIDCYDWESNSTLSKQLNVALRDAVTLNG